VNRFVLDIPNSNAENSIAQAEKSLYNTIES